MNDRPLPGALAIADGLTRTGRASDVEYHPPYLRIRASHGGYYWVSFDGTKVLRGWHLGDVEELQAGFVEAMEREGA